MEITRRFMKFLEELQDPDVQEKYVNLELEENLTTITQMIQKLKSSGLKKQPPSLNEYSFYTFFSLNSRIVSSSLKNL